MLKWLKQICLGMQYIHEQQIIHRDLKPANIFLTSATFDVKIGDFGFAKSLASEKFTNTMLGTKFFAAPEIRKQVPYNSKLDIWGIGCILLEMLLPQTCDYAYELALDANKLYAMIKQRYNDAMVEFCKAICKLEPEQRPKASEIVALINQMHDSLVQGEAKYDDSSESIANANTTSEQDAEVEQSLQPSALEVKELKVEVRRLTTEVKRLQHALSQKEEELFFANLESGTDENMSSKTSETITSPKPTSLFTNFIKSSSDMQELIPSKEIVIDAKKEKEPHIYADFTFATWKRKTDELPVVLKYYRKLNKPIDSLATYKQLCKIDMLQSFKHSSLERVYGVVEKDKQYHQVCEFINGTKLNQALLNLNITLSFKQIIQIVLDVAQGLMYLHERDLAYRVTSPPHMMLNSKNRVKFTSMRFAKAAGHRWLRDRIGYDYMSPQILKGSQKFNKEDDIYALSIIMYEAMFRKKAYEMLIKTYIISGKLRPAIPEKKYSVNEQAYLDLMQTSWGNDESLRPTAKHMVYKLSLLLQAEK